MSFLDDLKMQADVLRDQNRQVVRNLDSTTAETEAACRTVWPYLAELAPQLSVICPDGPRFALDEKFPWPAMQLKDFRVDSRRKFMRNQDVYGSMSMGWRIVPRNGPPVHDHVTVNFPPELKRAEARLATGNLTHDRREVRHPTTNKLQAIKFEYMTELRGSLLVTPDHDAGTILFRLTNATGFDVVQRVWPAVEVTVELLDEMSKLLLSQPNVFIGPA